MRTVHNLWIFLLLLVTSVALADDAGIPIKMVPSANNTAVHTSKELLDSCAKRTCDWYDFYGIEMALLSEMTASGFRTPYPLREDLSILGDVDWSKPVGFAVIDCEHKAYTLDGVHAPLKVVISWDPKRRCLSVAALTR